ncbi:hypothetical protein [Streptomyces europaeiscabiei]|uniref:hypothetical protein n=1 Tax=Streptomyces europaeiscabiei TaxID=146819 RepID=UPI002E26BC7E|nr:hypothetical protein OG858_00295 [Streptomyces europaeiscabiei]WUD38134.1 hypothetical protein OG858_46590 [Streptomyces europaeiscabiei]
MALRQSGHMGGSRCDIDDLASRFFEPADALLHADTVELPQCQRDLFTLGS